MQQIKVSLDSKAFEIILTPIFRQILPLNNEKGFILIFSNGRDANSLIFSMHEVETRGREKTEQEKVLSSKKTRIGGKASLLAI